MAHQDEAVNVLAVGDGTVVTVHYTLSDPDGTVVRTTRGRAPVSYLHGSAQLPPGSPVPSPVDTPASASGS